MTNQSTDQQLTDAYAVSETAHRHERAGPVASLSGWNVRIPVAAGWVHAATGVSLSFPAGEITTIVGESGCGKSMLLAALTGTLPEGTATTGTAQLVGRRPRTEAQWAELRGRGVAAMPAPASTGLSPTRSVGRQITEVLKRTKARNPPDPASFTDSAFSTDRVFSTDRDFSTDSASPDSASTDTVDSLLHSVGLDPEVASHYPHQLSGGMATRALLAATLAARPRLLLCDEPTIGLDPQVATSILKLLRSVAEAGTAVGLITHDLDLLQASGVADTVAVMYAGRIVEHTAADSFFAANAAQQRHPYARALLSSLPSRGFLPIPGLPPELTNLAPGYTFTDRVGQDWIDQQSGQAIVESSGDDQNPCVHGTVEATNNTVEATHGTVEATNNTVEARHGTVKTVNGTVETVNGAVETVNGTVETVNSTAEALQAEHLTLGHGDEPDLIDDFSLTLTHGSITGLSGPSGSGKTTVARALAGLHRARSGRVLLAGEPIATRPQRLSGDTALLFQSPRQAVDPEMTVRHLIAEPVTGRRGSHRRLRTRSRAASPVDVEALATRVGLTPDLLDRVAHQLSDGQLQRVCIARAIAQRPKVLLCDEATAMLDAASTATVAALVTELTRGEAGSPAIATLAISHDPALLAAWADHRIVLARH